jgi:hypothetical protein
MRAGLIWTRLICARMIQARDRGSAERRRVSVGGPGRGLYDERPQLFRRVRHLWWDRRLWARYWRARRPARFEPSLEQGAAHSAKTEIVRIVLTALRADHLVLPMSFPTV